MTTFRSASVLSLCASSVAPWIATGPTALADILSPGAFVSRYDGTPPNDPYSSNSDSGSEYGTYIAALPGTADDPTGTTASLNWGATTSSFSGTCAGSPTLKARSQAISLMTLESDATFSIAFSMGELVRAGNSVGWALARIGPAGEPDFVVQFEGTDGTSFGGVTPQADGTFTATVTAGQYLLVMLAECTATGGNFSYNATFTAVPGPGGVAALVVLGSTNRRRRRMS
jgi:hypothetical protein